MKITAYKCDVCGSVSEQEPEFTISNSESEDFEVSRQWKSYRYLPCACSEDCVKAALNVWLDNRRKESEIEVKELVLVGGQPA